MMTYGFRIALLGLCLLPRLLYAQGVDLAADTMTRDKDGIIIATGGVEVKREGETLKTDVMRYDAEHKYIQATGHVEILSPKAHIKAASASLHTQDKTGEFKQASMVLPQGERLEAESIRRLSETKFNADKISFTTCPPDAEAWRLYANHVDIDQEEGVLTAHGARFEIAEIPIFYTPYWQHPLRRRSGVLMPDFTTSRNRGTEYALPYYWAPSENFDVTLTPRWMTARGFMGEAEVRHSSMQGGENIQWSGLRDKQTHTYRQYVQTKIAHQLPKDWQFHAKIDYVSDHNFLSDFAVDYAGNTTRYLSSDVGISWQGKQADISLTGLYQQDLTQLNDDKTLQVLPRLESHYATPVVGDVLLHVDQQTTQFDRRVGVDGWRMALHPWLELPLNMQNGAITSTLQIGLHHIRYGQLNGAPALINQNRRTIYDASFETRSSFERVSSDRLWRHSISPVFRYDLASAPNQFGAVRFDTGFGKLTLNNLLQGNRFTGLDRFERMNRISFMLETDLQHKGDVVDTAHTLFTARAGVAYDMLRQTVDSALQTDALRPFSNLVGEVSISPMQGITFDASGQYDPVDKYWGTAQASMRLQHKQGHQLNVRWKRVDKRYSKAIELISGALDVQLAPRWKVFGQMYYDAHIKLTQQASAGIHYQHSCWDFKLEGYRNLNGGSTGKPDLGYRFLLGFKGLGSVGDS